MNTESVKLTRLSLLIQRILDADALCDVEGVVLLTETEAAHQALEAGDQETARRHISQIALFTEALVQTNRLAPGDGRAVLTATDGIFHQDANTKF